MRNQVSGKATGGRGAMRVLSGASRGRGILQHRFTQEQRAWLLETIAGRPDLSCGDISRKFFRTFNCDVTPNYVRTLRRNLNALVTKLRKPAP